MSIAGIGTGGRGKEARLVTSLSIYAERPTDSTASYNADRVTSTDTDSGSTRMWSPHQTRAVFDQQCDQASQTRRSSILFSQKLQSLANTTNSMCYIILLR